MAILDRLFSIDNEAKALRYLERIADALDRIAPPPFVRDVTRKTPTESNLIVTSDEELCRIEDQERERIQENLEAELERQRGSKAAPAS